MFDLVLRGGMVVDGRGGAGERLDLGIDQADQFDLVVGLRHNLGQVLDLGHGDGDRAGGGRTTGH